jgi:hypothetical protein
MNYFNLNTNTAQRLGQNQSSQPKFGDYPDNGRGLNARGLGIDNQ